MANKGFFLRDAYLSRTAKLTDDELGRLLRACMTYHATGQVTELAGRESIAFDFLREDIDEQTRAYDAKCETNRRNRMSTMDNDRQRPSTDDDDPQPEATAVHKVKVKEKVKVNVKEKVSEAAASAEAADDAADQEAFRLQADHDRILQAAENAGFPTNDIVRANLLDAYAEHGLDKTLRAIEECATHSASSIAYLKAVLSGKPRNQQKPARTVVAQQYSQRDYSGPEESMADALARYRTGS